MGRTLFIGSPSLSRRLSWTRQYLPRWLPINVEPNLMKSYIPKAPLVVQIARYQSFPQRYWISLSIQSSDDADFTLAQPSSKFGDCWHFYFSTWVSIADGYSSTCLHPVNGRFALYALDCSTGSRPGVVLRISIWFSNPPGSIASSRIHMHSEQPTCRPRRYLIPHIIDGWMCLE